MTDNEKILCAIERTYHELRSLIVYVEKLTLTNRDNNKGLMEMNLLIRELINKLKENEK